MLRKLSIESRVDPIAVLREYDRAAHLDTASRSSIVLVVEEEFDDAQAAATALHAIRARGTVAVRVAGLEACAGTDRSPIAIAPPPGRAGVCSVCRVVADVDLDGHIAPHEAEPEKKRKGRPVKRRRLLEID